MKKLFRRSQLPPRNDNPSPQQPQGYSQGQLPQQQPQQQVPPQQLSPLQQQQQQQQQQHHQSQQYLYQPYPVTTGSSQPHRLNSTGNPNLAQGFNSLSLTPSQQQQYPQQPYAQQIYTQHPYQQSYPGNPYAQPQSLPQSQSSPPSSQNQSRPQNLSPPYSTTSPSPVPSLQQPPSQQQQQQQQQQQPPVLAGQSGLGNRTPSQSNNDITRFLLEQGDNLVANNDFAGAITTYTLAIQSNPMDPDLLIKRAYAYRMVEPAKVEEALKDAQTACRSNPYDWRIWSQLGQIYLQNNDAHFAREALEKAIELGGNQVSSVTRSALDMARTMIERGSDSVSQPSVEISQPSQTPQPVQPIQPIQPTQPVQYIPPVQTTQPTQFQQSPQLQQPPQPQLPPRIVQPTQIQTPSPPAQPTPSPTPPVNNTMASSSSVTSNPTVSTTTTSTSPKAQLNTQNLSPQSAQHAPVPPPRSPNLGAQNVRTNAPAHILPTTETTNPAFAPPTYAPNTTSTDPAVRGLSQQALTAQLNEFQAQLSTRLRGAMSAKAYTTVDKMDTVKLVYVGLEQHELTNKELGTPVFAHPAFQRIYASTVDYPGSTYLDFDPETLVIYDGGAPGTLSVSGYAEEYRQQQFQRTPRVTLALEQQTPLPEVTIDFLVKRIHTLQYPSTHSKTDAALKQVLGNSPLLTGTDALQTQIEAICYTLNRKDPVRFANYTQSGRNVTNHLFGSKDQGIGVKNWLHQLVLGSELLLRLRAETRTVSYTGLITDEISALLFVCDEFMKDVDIRIKPEKPGLDDPSRYTFVAREHTRQSAALIRFAEVLKWPFMDEVRNYCENAFDDIIAGRYVIFDIYDWLYSLFRPGFHFRFQLMSCLRYATPHIRDLGGAPYYESGLVVGNKSYWSRRTVLGKVLGGCKTSTMVCGWIGPCIKPTGVEIKPVKKDGADVQVEGAWVELTARAVSCPVPCSGAQDTNYQYQRADEDESTFVSHLVNAENWMPASGPSLGAVERPYVKLKTLMLQNVKGTPKADATELEKRPSYRPSITFTVGTGEISYTLYSNPFFVYANPCIGEHPLFDRQIAKLTKNTFQISQLKDAYPEPNSMIVIDALSANEDGDEECLARAWCSERGLNAIIRRGKGCCYGCAVTLATQRLGLGFNVLICS